MCFFRASDILRKKKQNFAGFSGVNSRKNRPISRKKSQNLRKNRPILRDFRGKKSKFAEKSANFAGLSQEKVKIRGKIGRFRGILAEKSQISKDFRGQIHRKFGRFHGKFRQETIGKKQPISLFLGAQISLKTISFASI